MSNQELEDAFEQEITLLLYTDRIGRFVAGRVFVLHWPAKSDAFIIEAIEGFDHQRFYWVQRSDPSLIVKPA
jgi:hypothetical protein